MIFHALFRKYHRRKLSRRGYATAGQRRKATAEVAQISQADAGRKRPPRWLIVGITALLWILAAASISYDRRSVSYDYVVGQKVANDIYSEVPFDYVNRRETQMRREQASRQVPFAYRINETAVSESVESLKSLQDAMVAFAQKNADLPPGKSVAPELSADALSRNLIRGLREEEMLDPLFSVFTSARKTEKLINLVRLMMMRGIITEELDGTFHAGMTSEDVVTIVDPRGRRSNRKVSELMTLKEAATRVTERYRKQYPAAEEEVLQAVSRLTELVAEPNLDFAPEVTEAARAQAAAEVDVVRKGVPAGVPLLQRGETVTPDDLVKLRVHAEEMRARQDTAGTVIQVLVDVALVLVLSLIFMYGLWLINPKIFNSGSMLIMVGVIAGLQIVIARLGLDLYNLHYHSSVYRYAIIPMAFGPMLLALLLDVRTAVWVGVFTALVAAMQSYDSFIMLLAGAVAAFAGAVFVQNATKRFHMLRAGFAVSLAVFIISALYAIDQDMPVTVVPRLIGFSLLNGIVTAMVASTVLPLFEYLFGVITDISLLELSDLNHPLLKRLQMEAPGTYHHSLLVATLAEQAATAIGANSLLARVCAYFHDIGKISQAEYFAENINLSSGSNPHDELQPRMSSLIILNHVKGGVELAAKYKLKRVIREAIGQHHGSSLISYFYNRAKEDSEDRTGKEEKVEPHNYRYPGPPPARKEVALISIADACEAATRSLEKPTPRKIEHLVDKIVYGRIQDGQLDRADLTFRELAIGKATIASALGNMLHARVAYEKKTKKNDKARTKKTDKQALVEEPPAFNEDTA
ncbi:MAG: HDIG domain-containing protein [Lentisphaeria bacterium]